MNASTTVLLVLVALLLVPVLLYNGLVSRRNAAENAFASLDANLQKRYDLVPNLVATVKGAMAHERDTLEAIVRLRNEAIQSRTARLQNDGAMAQMMTQIVAQAESYPQLKTSDNFLHLQRTLNEVEEQISASRRAFNACVNDYNTACESFPGSLMANACGFRRRDFFEAGDDARQTPQIAGGLG